MEAAMSYLAETDQAYADYVASKLRCEILGKRVRARAFIESEGSVEVRKAKSENHADVIEADKCLVEAVLYLESLKAKRGRAEIVIDVWRSINASQRKS
jgi:hypothetical protein